MTTRRTSSFYGLLWVLPWIVGLLVFYAIPMAMSLVFSLTDYTMIEPPLWIGLDNYAQLLDDHVFWQCVRNTVVYASVAIPLAMVLSLAIAALLNTDLTLAGVIKLLVFAPMVVPLVASAMIWLWLFNGDHGLLNSLLGLIGIAGPNWLEARGWAMASLVIMSLWSIGQAVIIYLAALRNVPRTLRDQAAIEGMGPLQRFIHVVLPAIAPAVLFNAIIQIITAWQVFAAPYIMTEGGPDRSTYFYSHYVYDQAFVYQQMGYASALGWVQLLLLSACVAFLYAIWRRLAADR